ncbi:mycocerosic acid synthase-like polyketide synthase [Mercenaria mercenaria]|uniref:mycocerosic acid synthase-like polyketide synthase n=1 Tax=Mercenaria mercenaria TaxID=6596 RepID=UPI00234F77CE|nr:mycocerosic acid synthase-like polyketide synthase [Mercenaria mercenaria]
MEAELIDPQQRMVLDCVHMALEDGGIRRKDIEGTDTGVYIGCMTDDYKGHVMDDSSISSTYSVTGTQASIISARVAYAYNLSGTALTLDTACSSSLVAINVASQELKFGSCSLAICGGVNVLMDPQLFVALSKARMLSPSGQCKTFTNEADGYARGEGCGIVILKKLKGALKDGNKIWATIKTGSNQDGHMIAPITAPSGIQQENLIKKVYTKYAIDKSKIQVIEAHGTGTPIGDPTEANALGNNFGRVAKAQGDVYIGSVKTNIGHLEAAAGVAGIIKVLLMMKHGTIVPSLWYTKENENPKLNLSKYGFLVPTKCVKWDSPANIQRLACVNSFGFGGTNAHAIVEEYNNPSEPFCKESMPPESLPYLVTLSAFDKDTLISNVQHLYDSLKLQDYDLAVLSCTSTCKRDHRNYRKAFFGKSQEEILGQCSTFLNISESVQAAIEMKNIVFVFCGVGTAWNGMCKSLMKIGTFEAEIQKLDNFLKPLTGWAISEIFYEGREIVLDPMVAHIAIFACQVGLVALWRHYGIKPDVVVGQSVGEVAAAYVAGILDLQTAVKVIYNRSKYLATVKQGQMAVVRNVAVDVVQRLCDESKGSLHISVFQSPISCTVSGSEKAIQTFKESLQQFEDIDPDIRELDVQCAYHSPYVVDASKQLGREVKGITVKKSSIPVYSTVSGKLESDGWFGSASYWENNVRQPVMFGAAIKSSVSDKRFTVFIEIGPSPVLRAHISSILRDNKNYAVYPSMTKRDEIHTLAGTLCDLYGTGLDLNWSALNACHTRTTDVPMYQLRKYKQLYQSPSAIMRNQGVGSVNIDHLYITQQPQKEGNIHLKAEVDEKTTPFVFQHVVTGFILLPGAFYADIGFEICRALGRQQDLTFVSLEFLRPVKIDKGMKAVLYVSTINQKDEVLFHVKHNQITMCKGWVHPVTFEETYHHRTDIERLKLSIVYNGSRSLSGKEIYEMLDSMGFQYGPYLRLLKSSTSNGNESLTETIVPKEVFGEIDKTTIHPCILDAMMQSTIITTSKDLIQMVQNESLTLLPVSLGQINVLRKPDKKMYIYTKRINLTLLETVLMIHYNILLMTSDGTAVADLRNYTTYGKRNAAVSPCELNYRITWHPFELEKRDKADEPKTIVLTSMHLDEIEDFVTEDENNTIIHKGDNMTNAKYADNAFLVASKQWNGLQNVDAVILLIETGAENDICQNDAEWLHNIIKDNCLLFTEVVKSMTRHNFKANLYVVTQNTQATFPMKDRSINIVGGELWGFVRSVYTEFIHGDITLVDLQSYNVDTKETLHSLIKNTCRHTELTKLEVVIYQNKLYGAQFTKVPKKEIIQSLRDENRSVDIAQKSYRVLASVSQRFPALLSPVVVQPESSSENAKNHMTIRIKFVSMHPLFMFPRTTGGKKLEQDIWQEPLDDGQQILGLEYVGYQVNKRKNGRFVCKSTKIESEYEDFDNQWEVVVLFPAEILTEMLVPNDCTVCLKDIPFYQPGLLLYATLSWQIVDIVQKSASVVIHCKNETEQPATILRTMLKDRKNSYILDLSKDIKDKQGDIDFLISLDHLDAGFFLLGKCKTIICFEDSVSDSFKTRVAKTGEQYIRSINVSDALARKQVSKILPKVVSWLQKNYRHHTTTPTCTDNLSDSSSTCEVPPDEHCRIPCPTVDLMNAHKICLPVRNPLGNLFARNGVYIITGGLTGLGWELLLLIAEMGAGCVVSMSRRNVSEDKMTQIRQMEEQTGCKFVSLRADVTDLVSVQEALEELRGKVPGGMTLRGIFHGAGVIQSKLLVDIDEDNVEFILKPKVLGTLNLHVATESLNLDYFVVASSINSLVGSPGQCTYGAANSFLDAFMEWRRRKSLAGQSINWGALSVGMASRPEFTENFSKRGFNLLSVLEIRSCFQQAMMQNSTCTVFANINWDMFAKDYTNPKLARIRLQMSVLIDQMVSFVMELDNDGIDNMTFDVETLKLADQGAQKLAISQFILKVTTKVTGGDVSQIKSASTLAELSFDSMSTLTFINIVHDFTGYRIHGEIMANTSSTLDDVGNLLYSEIFETDTRKEDTTGMLNVPIAIVSGEINAMAPVDS